MRFQWKYGLIIGMISMVISTGIIGFKTIPGGSISAPLNLLFPILLGIISIILFSVVFKISKGLGLALLILFSLMNIYYALII
jgi:hypothetical protein